MLQVHNAALYGSEMLKPVRLKVVSGDTGFGSNCCTGLKVAPPGDGGGVQTGTGR